jgi:DNA-binding CsgD family transcriptional regulator
MAGALLQRDAELATLARQLAPVRAGAGRVIIVEGPSGIGKSSLLAAAARAADASGIRILRAWGGPLEQDAGWGIARQLFAGVRGGPEWTEVAVGAAALARRALDADAVEPALPPDAMHAATHGLTWLASGLAERGPTLLVIDDVHWADAPSLRWLVGLTRQLAELRLGVLCAIRAGEPPARPDLLAELVAAAPEPPLRPTPLGPDAVESMVGRRLPAAGRTFAHACHAASAGNPFLLGALLDHIVAKGIGPTDEVAARLSAFGPEQVGRSVERQLSRLPAHAGPLARAFAVLGRTAPLRHGRDLARLSADEAARSADQLCAAGLSDRDGDRYTLVHPLVASALYHGMPAAERALWHSRAAELLTRDRADPETVALHLLRGEPAGAAATVATLRAAAHRATARGAPETAEAFLRRALSEPPPDQTAEADIRAGLGLVLAARLGFDAVTMLDSAVQLATSAEQRSRLALSSARAFGLAGHFTDAARLCRRALERPGDTAPEVVSRLEAELTGNAALTASGVAEARQRIVHHSPASPELWHILDAWEAAADARPATEVRELLARALDAEVLDREPDSILTTYAKFTLILCDELDQARDRCTALIDIARPRGWLIALAHGSLLRAFALLRAGQVRDAEADARLAFDIKLANSPPPALLWSLAPLAEALIELDELDEAEAVLAATELTGDPPSGDACTPMVLNLRARLRLAQHRPAEAHADLTQAAGCWARLSQRHPGLAAWRIDDCEALVALGDLPAARAVATEHLELAERVGLPGPYGAGLRALARASGATESIALLERAVDVLAGSPARLEYARALVDLGCALRRANRRAAAREPLLRALALADPGGMRRLARRARHELHAAGARPRRAALSGVDSLTAAEHRVATLAARGHSNIEIAQQLYVTRRTVETHLTHAFQKLGIATRAELNTCLGDNTDPTPRQVIRSSAR